MKTKINTTFVSKSQDTAREMPSENQEKTQTFQVQTGVRAGGFYDRFYSWWEGVSDGFNEFDQNTGAG